MYIVGYVSRFVSVAEINIIPDLLFDGTHARTHIYARAHTHARRHIQNIHTIKKQNKKTHKLTDRHTNTHAHTHMHVYTHKYTRKFIHI